MENYKQAVMCARECLSGTHATKYYHFIAQQQAAAFRRHALRFLREAKQ